MESWDERPVLTYLLNWTSAMLDSLYASPGSAVAVFRLLPDSAQLIVSRLAWLGNGRIFKCSWRSWHSNESEEILLKNIKNLNKLRIIEGMEQLALNPIFGRAYLHAIRIGFYRASKMTEVVDGGDKARKYAKDDLEKKGNERWECILHYLALPSQVSEQGVSGTTKLLFKSAGLTTRSDDDSDFVEITSAGFHFLLLNRTEQIWTYVLHYLRMQEAGGNNVLEIIEFLFRLTLCVTDSELDFLEKFNGVNEKLQYSRPYLIDETWSDNVKNFMLHLRELGVIFIRKRKDGYFFLTPLINHLTMSCFVREAESEQASRTGFLIVETNYRVYAYTESSLQLSILSTFTEMHYRFNNMAVGILSRESVRKALRVGITASQIISYLRTNTHPAVVASSSHAKRKFATTLPTTIVDQLRLWEDEKRRIKMTSSAVYSSFDSESEFLELKEYVKNLGVMLWFDNVQRLVVVTEAGHSQVKHWWKSKGHNKTAVK